jgi:lipopolysaccharide biosynthesis protein
LEQPFNEVLRSGKPDFPFCLCWANENWTKAWDGLEKEVLMKQDYNAEDRVNHIEWLCKAFKDPRYIKVNNKPLLLIYRTDNIPDLKERIADWKHITRKYGFDDLYLCSVRSNFNKDHERDVIDMGFDAVVEFQPYAKDFPSMSLLVLLRLAASRLINKLIALLKLESTIPLFNENIVIRYDKVADNAMNKPHPAAYKKFPCVFPSWDNSARKRVANIIQNTDVTKYAEWLMNALQRIKNYTDDERIVFINAWNEWAEGCHLEPDLMNGKKFLEATGSVIQNYNAGHDQHNGN